MLFVINNICRLIEIAALRIIYLKYVIEVCSKIVLLNLQNILLMGQTNLPKYDFRCLEQIKDLGSGSYGVVKLLYQKESKKVIVGKLLSMSGTTKLQKKQISDAEKEAKLHARLQHKNIVQILGTTVLEDRKFGIILEYIPCGDLESLLMGETDDNVSISLKICARFFIELADALNYLHNHDRKRPYIHGDLKPQNILLGDKLNIKLADLVQHLLQKLLV